MKKIKKSMASQLTRAEAFQLFVSIADMQKWSQGQLAQNFFVLDVLIEALKSVGAINDADMNKAAARLQEAAKNTQGIAQVAETVG